ncbi:hypothetical protein CCC_01417 [Paramagnetospirillum magnetotacticum MS-1]|uniref:Uncharacterized protein n=1 Tax=Paramagnetospirillum magnetotacticum MS-1 TaxID=272627 RepID=A0A0C2YAZ0_PARME|nr:hypothetical protein CCC_01417 [Paramagnetospirillum magnetotacticum MS-1]
MGRRQAIHDLAQVGRPTGAIAARLRRGPAGQDSVPIRPF